MIGIRAVKKPVNKIAAAPLSTIHTMLHIKAISNIERIAMGIRIRMAGI